MACLLPFPQRFHAAVDYVVNPPPGGRPSRMRRPPEPDPIAAIEAAAQPAGSAHGSCPPPGASAPDTRGLRRALEPRRSRTRRAWCCTRCTSRRRSARARKASPGRGTSWSRPSGSPGCSWATCRRWRPCACTSSCWTRRSRRAPPVALARLLGRPPRSPCRRAHGCGRAARSRTGGRARRPRPPRRRPRTRSPTPRRRRPATRTRSRRRRRRTRGSRRTWRARAGRRRGTSTPSPSWAATCTLWAATAARPRCADRRSRPCGGGRRRRARARRRALPGRRVGAGAGDAHVAPRQRRQVRAAHAAAAAAGGRCAAAAAAGGRPAALRRPRAGGLGHPAALPGRAHQGASPRARPHRRRCDRAGAGSTPLPLTRRSLLPCKSARLAHR